MNIDRSKYLFLDEVLRQDHGWSPESFYDVDPSPSEHFFSEKKGRTSFHYSMRFEREKIIPIIKSRVIDQHGRSIATDISEVFSVGRRVIFLPEPANGQIAGYLPNSEYLADMKAVGVANSFFDTEFKIVGCFGEQISMMPVNLESHLIGSLHRIDFSGANPLVEDKFNQTQQIEIGAFLLLWHDRVLLSRCSKKSRRNRFVGRRSFWKSSLEKQITLLSDLLDGCPKHPAYKPSKRNNDTYCSSCDLLRTKRMDLDTLRLGRPIRQLDLPSVHRR